MIKKSQNKCKNLYKPIFWLLIIIGLGSGIVGALANVRQENSVNKSSINNFKIEPGIYIFVSFTMNDAALRSYFIEAQHYEEAKLVMRGFVDSGNITHNRFTATKDRIEKAKINIDINPDLFEQLGVTRVPVIAMVDKQGNIKKISGHISLKSALERMRISDIEIKHLSAGL